MDCEMSQCSCRDAMPAEVPMTQDDVPRLCSNCARKSADSQKQTTAVQFGDVRKNLATVILVIFLEFDGRLAANIISRYVNSWSNRVLSCVCLSTRVSVNRLT